MKVIRLFMYVCMYVCMYACMHVCMHEYILDMYLCIYVCLCVWICVSPRITNQNELRLSYKKYYNCLYLQILDD